MSETRSHLTGETDVGQPPIVGRMLENISEPALDRPERVRAIIFDPSGQQLLLILRKRAGLPPYAVFPGGGMEPHEGSPLETRSRELKEELSIDPTSVEFASKFIEFDDQWMYVGVASNTSMSLRFAGPELNESMNKGSFQPSWVRLERLEQVNLVPYELRELILRNAQEGH